MYTVLCEQFNVQSRSYLVVFRQNPKIEGRILPIVQIAAVELSDRRSNGCIFEDQKLKGI